MRAPGLLLAAIALPACGPDVQAACEAYVDAWVACIETAYVANQTELDILVASTDGTCQEYVGLEKDAQVEDVLTCYANLYTNADCTSEAGYVSATQSLAACGGE
jgi:hypothetical protein